MIELSGVRTSWLSLEIMRLRARSAVASAVAARLERGAAALDLGPLGAQALILGDVVAVAVRGHRRRHRGRLPDRCGLGCRRDRACGLRRSAPSHGQHGPQRAQDASDDRGHAGDPYH